jgi:phosphopantetheinyl transferase
MTKKMFLSVCDTTIRERGLPAFGGAGGDQGWAEGTVRILNPLGFHGSVVFASAPSVQGAELRLALSLLQALAGLDPSWCAPVDENEFTLQKSALGAPFLLAGERPGPSLSFSHGKGRLWAAMSGKGDVGMDVAYPEEFAGAYPFHRAFRTEELGCAEAICPGDTARGAALMWAAKEAAVKATGTGFNLFDPLEVRVGKPFVREEGILFEVLADRPIPTWVTTEGMGWLAVALA